MTATLRHRDSERSVHILTTSVELFDDWGLVEEEVIGRTLNVSEGGVSLELNHPLPLLATLSLKIAFGEEIVEAKGEVIRLAVTERRTVDIAVHFTELSPEGREIIRHHYPPGTQATGSEREVS